MQRLPFTKWNVTKWIQKNRKDRVFPEKRQVFVIRIWTEPREISGEKSQMRGVIEHVTSGEKQYFLELDEIEQFIFPFVQDLGMSQT